MLGHLSADGLPDATFGPAPDGTGVAIYSDDVLDPNFTKNAAAATLSVDPTTGNLIVGGILTQTSSGTTTLHGYVMRFTSPLQ
jgi:hypothetical protein